jgi:hypothetical protein
MAGERDFCLNQSEIEREGGRERKGERERVRGRDRERESQS